MCNTVITLCIVLLGIIWIWSNKTANNLHVFIVFIYIVITELSHDTFHHSRLATND